MKHTDLIPHLFRSEFAKITTVLCRQFGIRNIEVAEDIAGETFLSALQSWSYKGIPENPTAWLYAVAKNKARNEFSRARVFTEHVLPQLINSSTSDDEIHIDLSDQNIIDSQLQMLFAVCHPCLSAEAQTGLALRILCGFGIDEIASAFVTSKETISKRLYRAKETLRLNNIPIEFPLSAQLQQRLSSVLTTLYLLFNEGYYSETDDAVLREDLCLEAMRLTLLLIDNEATNLPQVNALLSLMCFHASRFAARKKQTGEMIEYADQDETLWNRELITKGGYYLNQSSKGNVLSKYHIEAGIAYWHTIKADTKEKWETILQLYNQLLIVEYSPIAALNRTYAFSKVKGNEAAIKEAEKLELHHNPYYHTLLGELYKEMDTNKAKAHLQTACSLAKTISEKQTIQKKIRELEVSFTIQPE